MRRYASEASERWEGFAHRPGDIVLSTRSKCGTTWVQMICALLVHGPVLPAPLAEISPWLDWDVEPVDAVHARLAAQAHRRVVKTHTPLDGIPLVAGTTYVVVGRHPLDVAVSLHHHGANIDRARMAELSGRPSPGPPPMSVEERLRAWIAGTEDPAERLDTLPGLLHHLTDAWGRRHEPHVVLVHYQDLVDDLEGQMRRMARLLAVPVPERAWPDLVRAAGFDAMRADAEALAPDRLGVLRDRHAFFRAGRSGEGRALLTAGEIAHDHARAADLGPADLLTWLHR